MPQYTASLREYHALEMTNGAAVNSTVQTVHATDGDGPDTPAGQIEYRIVSGNTINGEKIFDILIPSVSELAMTMKKCWLIFPRLYGVFVCNDTL